MYSTIINSTKLNNKICDELFNNRSIKFYNLIIKYQDIILEEYYCNKIDKLNDINNKLNDNLDDINDVDKLNDNNKLNDNDNKLNDNLDDINNVDKLNDNDLNNDLNDINNINEINDLNNKPNKYLSYLNNIVNIDIITDNNKYMLIDLNKYNQLFKFTFSSQHLGVIGENHIYDTLFTLGYNPINTTKTAHVGDIHLKFDNFMIMFEIKNKLKITREDIIKFKSDIETLKQTNENVCGCFISLCEYSPFKFNIYETYMTNPDEHMLQTYIESLKMIFQSNNNLISIQNKLNDQLINYSSEIKIIDKHIKYSEELNKDMINLKKSLSTKLDVLISILKGLDPNLDNKYKLQHDLKNYILNNSKWTIKDCKNIVQNHNMNITFKTKDDVIVFINNLL